MWIINEKETFNQNWFIVNADPATEYKQDTIIDNQTNGTQKTQIIDGLNIGSYDYFSLTQDTLTDTYTFKLGGASGTTVATVLITYTSADKSTISSVLKS